MTTLSLSKIKIELIDTINTPTVKFRWTRGNDNGNLDNLESHIVYALIICAENDIPLLVNKISHIKYKKLFKEPEIIYKKDKKENISEL